MMKILTLLTFICAILTIWFDYTDKRFVWLFKPATMIFIIAILWFYGKAQNFYLRTILVGLIFSLIGDVLLINPQNFVYGLAAFLIAHCCYIAAFAKAGKGSFNLLSLVAFIIGIALLSIIYGGVSDSLKIPVIIYATAISTMLCTAFNFWLTKKTPQAQFALAGAISFVVSDSILALNKFGYEFFEAKFLILATYFFAQWLIARSTVNE